MKIIIVLILGLFLVSCSKPQQDEEESYGKLLLKAYGNTEELKKNYGIKEYSLIDYHALPDSEKERYVILDYKYEKNMFGMKDIKSIVLMNKAIFLIREIQISNESLKIPENEKDALQATVKARVDISPFDEAGEIYKTETTADKEKIAQRSFKKSLDQLTTSEKAVLDQLIVHIENVKSTKNISWNK